MPTVRELELTFAYRAACEAIESVCDPVDDPMIASVEWFDLDDVGFDAVGEDGEDAVSEAIVYLDSRRLVLRHETNTRWVQILDEGEPLPEPKSNEISLVPTGLQTPEGCARVNAAMEAHQVAIVNLANFAGDFERKCAYELSIIGEEHKPFGELVEELREHVSARENAQDEMLRAIAGHPKAGA